MTFAEEIKVKIKKMKHVSTVDHVSFNYKKNTYTEVCYANVLGAYHKADRSLLDDVECIQNNYSQKVLDADVFFDWMTAFQDNGFVNKEVYFYIKNSKTYLFMEKGTLYYNAYIPLCLYRYFQYNPSLVLCFMELLKKGYSFNHCFHYSFSSFTKFDGHDFLSCNYLKRTESFNRLYFAFVINEIQKKVEMKCNDAMVGPKLLTDFELLKKKHKITSDKYSVQSLEEILIPKNSNFYEFDFLVKG